MKSLTILMTLALCACTGDDGDTDVATDTDAAECGAPYSPFDAGNYENQLLRVAAYGQIVDIRKSDTFTAASFADVEELYATAGLNEKVAGRKDDHPDASVLEIGAVLDEDITTAIAAGKADTDIAIQGQIIDKTLQRFFALSVYHEANDAEDDTSELGDVQVHWDEAFGYFGMANDGQETAGIADTLAKRDAEFGTSLADTAFNALVDGRCALEGDDRATAVEARDEADRAILQGFALSVAHEMDEYDENPLIKGWEGKLYWQAIADDVYALDADAHDAIVAEFDKDVELIDPTVVRQAIMDAYGFDF